MDLQVIETGNGGDILKKEKDLSVINGWQNMIYLALFGGNVKASTSTTRLLTEQAFDWWGNSLLFPNDPSLQFNSLTEKAINSNALTSAGRIRIEEAVKKDLEFMKPLAEITPVVSIPGNDKLQISIKVKELNNLQEKEFIYIWDSTKAELQ